MFADEAPTKWMQRPAVMAGASAGLGAAVAAIVVLVWSFSSGPQSVEKELKPDSAASPAAAAPAALTPPEPTSPPADLPGGLPGGLPAGLTDQGQGGLPAGVPAGLLQQGSATGSPLAAFTPRPSVISGGGGGGSSAALPALPQLPAAPDLQTVMDTAAPYLWPALAPSIVSGDAISGLIGSIGGWVTAAGVATANNATTLLSNLILAAAVNRNGNPLGVITQASQGVASLANLPSLPGLSLPTPEQALNLPAQLAVNMPALDALSKLAANRAAADAASAADRFAAVPDWDAADWFAATSSDRVCRRLVCRRLLRSVCRLLRLRFSWPCSVSDPTFFAQTDTWARKCE